MIISLFAAGEETLLSVKEGDNRTETFSFDSKILFQNPSLFYNRFILLLHSKYPKVLETSAESNYLINSLIFSVPGALDTESGIILSSRTLNQIARPNRWSGFNFKKCFEDLLPEDKIILVNAGLAASYGIKKLFPDIKLPILVILLENEIELSLIHPDGLTEKVQWADEPLENLQGKTANEVLSAEAIEEIIKCGTIGIIETFTGLLAETIDAFLKYSNELVKHEIGSVVLLTRRAGFIDINFLNGSFQNLKILMPDEQKRKDTISEGTFLYYEEASRVSNRVIKIEYWSGEELIYTFENYMDFFNHWAAKKILANPENEYRIHYDNGHIKRIKIKHLNFEEKLKEFMF